MNIYKNDMDLKITFPILTAGAAFFSYHFIWENIFLALIFGIIAIAGVFLMRYIYT